MKIQAISNTNFKGLFTDKSAQNNGNWKMEYSPYSWEHRSWDSFGMADQKDVEILSSILPDNEKIYIPERTYGKGKRSCKDILGTEFYYKDFDKNTARSEITEVPSMNREDSLRVYNKKLEKFASLKDARMAEDEEAVSRIAYGLNSDSWKYHDRSSDVRNGILDRIHPRKDSYKQMDECFNRMTSRVEDMKNNMEDYIFLHKSKEDVKEQIAVNSREISLLENARKSGKLIDISRRFKVYDPNKALWEALQDIKTAADKIIALPHKTISVKDLLNVIGNKVKSADIPDAAIKYVDRIISSRA